MDDIKLARAAADGDQEAFDLLVRSYRPYIYTIAYNVSLNVEDALDITQNVLVLLVRKIGTFSGRGSFKGWIATLAAREAVSHARSPARRETATEPEELARHVDGQSDGGHTPHPGDRLDAEARRRQIEAALPALSPQQRAIFSLLFREQLRPREISQRLEIPENQVSIQIHRSLAKLRQMLAPAKGGDKAHE